MMKVLSDCFLNKFFITCVKDSWNNTIKYTAWFLITNELVFYFNIGLLYCAIKFIHTKLLYYTPLNFDHRLLVFWLARLSKNQGKNNLIKCLLLEPMQILLPLLHLSVCLNCFFPLQQFYQVLSFTNKQHFYINKKLLRKTIGLYCSQYNKFTMWSL